MKCCDQVYNKHLVHKAVHLMETEKDMELITKVVHAIYFTALAWQHQEGYNCELFSSV